MQVRDQAVIDVLHCVRETLLSKRLKPAAAVRCQRLLREAERTYLWQVSSSRQDHVVPVAALGESNCQDGADEITTHEAAQLLGCSVRTVQRLAPALGVRRQGRWVLKRRRVLTHKQIRDEENEDDRTAAA
jgi:hypothetical protein